MPGRNFRLQDYEAPLHVVEVDDTSPGFVAEGAWELRAGEGHYCGPGFRVSPKPGSTATWAFVAPSSDTFTILAAVPGGKELTDAAGYELRGADGTPSVTIDQRPADGAWVELFEAALARSGSSK